MAVAADQIPDFWEAVAVEQEEDECARAARAARADECARAARAAGAVRAARAKEKHQDISLASLALLCCLLWVVGCGGSYHI